MNEIIVIVDCNYLAYVNKFALSQGLTYRGNPTEIIFGFLRHVNELSRQFQTNQFVFCWDSHKSIRKEIYPEYKANRHLDKTQEDISGDKIAYAQFNELKDYVLPKMGFANVFYKDQYESDDIIASIVKNNKIEGKRYVVVSNDSDLYQLLDDCKMYNISKKCLTTKETFIREHGIGPERWHLVKAIAGCSTDNVFGIVGVGEKTAIKYLNGELKIGKKTKDIENSYDIFHRNLKLVTLPFDGIGTFNIRMQECFSEKNFITICEDFGFNSFLTQRYLQSWINQFAMR